MAKTIGICGGSASGKTTFTQQLADLLGPSKCAILSLDSYYIDFTRNNMSSSEVNYDQPKSFDMNLFARHIISLRAGQSINSPVYDYTTHKRLTHTRNIPSLDYILIEGLFLFNIPQCTSLFDIKVFIDTPSDSRLERRIIRDIKERDRDLQSIHDQYFHQVLPMHTRHVEPNKALAHVIIDGEKPFSGQMTSFSRL